MFQNIGDRAFVFSHDGDYSLLDDTGVTVVEDIEQADFVLLLGMRYPQKSLEDYEKIIRRTIQRNLKVICANQDSRGLIGTNFLTGPFLIGAAL